MGLFDRLKNGINPEGPDYDDQDAYTQQIQNDFNDNNMYQQNNQQYQPQQEQYQPQQPMGDPGMSVSGSNLELKVVKPERFDNVSQIANHLLNRRTVVLNLESTNKESARRLIDFLSGVAYSIDGYIQRVANNTFVIVPNNVDVSGEQLQEAKKQEDTELF